MSNLDSNINFGNVSVNLVKPKAPVIGKICAIERCVSPKSHTFVKHIVVDISGTPLEGTVRSGQAFGVIPPGTSDSGKPHFVRLYSNASPTKGEDNYPGAISTTVKRVIDEKISTEDDEGGDLFLGVCSNYLCDLKVGDEVKVSGPNGKRFLLPENPSEHNYLFIATGTGIAPFRGMIKELLKESPSSKIHLVMGVPFEADLIYDPYFTDLSKNGLLNYYKAISRERNDGKDRGCYTDQRIEREIEIFKPILKDEKTLIYVCGILGMEEGIFKMLKNNNLDHSYLALDELAKTTDVKDWDRAFIRRHVHTTDRLMVEVYE